MNINYIRSGDYFIPDLKLPEETRPIGKWGRMYRGYLKEYHPIRFNNLVLSGNLWTYLANLNEQAKQRMETLIAQMQSAEGITEALKAADPISWTQRMNNIATRAEEIIRDGFRELDDLLRHLPLEDNNAVFNLCCSLCTAYEHKAFLDGVQYGAHLVFELFREEA